MLGRLMRKFARAAEMLERPHLLRVRLRGGSGAASTAAELDRPWLRDLRFATILDIGANTGQFAIAARAVFPSARILSFEPLGDCCVKLKALMRGDANFEAFQLALGDSRGELQFERNEFSPASSFLPLNQRHKEAFEFAQKTQAVAVVVERLDDLAPKLNLAEPILAKLDVQGYEDRVLRGGAQTFRRASVLLVEMSYEPLYEKQMLFDEMCAWPRNGIRVPWRAGSFPLSEDRKSIAGEWHLRENRLPWIGTHRRYCSNRK